MTDAASLSGDNILRRRPFTAPMGLTIALLVCFEVALLMSMPSSTVHMELLVLPPLVLCLPWLDYDRTMRLWRAEFRNGGESA